MKKLLLSIAIMLMATVTAFAQVPTVMMYQVMVKHGKAAAQDITIEMQLRTSQNGVAVWNQIFELTDVENRSVQNLALDFGDKIDLGAGEYWIATIVDGVEKGCAKLCSVPYAMMTKRVEGVILREELVGTWEGLGEDELTHIEFKEDGTFTAYTDEYDDYYNEHSYERFKGNWMLNGAGNVYFECIQYSDDYKAPLQKAKKGVQRKDDGYWEKKKQFVCPTFYNAEKGELVFVTQDDSELFEVLKSFHKTVSSTPDFPSDGNIDTRLVGTWFTYITDEDGEYQLSFTFNSDGTFVAQYVAADWNESQTGNWCAKDDVIYLELENDGENVSMSFAFKGDTLVLTDGDDSFSFEKK